MIDSQEKKGGSFLKELLHFALIVIFIVLPIRLFVAQPFVVVGTSMEPTFINNDYLIVDELTYRLQDPQRGDVVIFKYVEGAQEQGEKQKYFIKRVIGLPSETVDIRNGTVTIYNEAHPEGIALDETYVKEKPTNTMRVTLGEDEYFVMGDNRSVSFDSRSWGPLERKEIVGKAFLRILPFSDAGILPGSHAGHYTNETD
jgi:signal peptidase I